MPRSRQNILFNFKLKNEESRANLNKNKRLFKCNHFGISCMGRNFRFFLEIPELQDHFARYTQISIFFRIISVPFDFLPGFFRIFGQMESAPKELVICGS